MGKTLSAPPLPAPLPLPLPLPAPAATACANEFPAEAINEAAGGSDVLETHQQSVSRFGCVFRHRAYFDKADRTDLPAWREASAAFEARNAACDGGVECTEPGNQQNNTA